MRHNDGAVLANSCRARVWAGVSSGRRAQPRACTALTSRSRRTTPRHRDTAPPAFSSASEKTYSRILKKPARATRKTSTESDPRPSGARSRRGAPDARLVPEKTVGRSGVLHGFYSRADGVEGAGDGSSCAVDMRTR